MVVVGMIMRPLVVVVVVVVVAVVGVDVVK